MYLQPRLWLGWTFWINQSNCLKNKRKYLLSLREAVGKKNGQLDRFEIKVKNWEMRIPRRRITPLPSFGSGRPPLESKAIFLSNSFTLSTFSQHRLTINVHSYVRSFKACRRSTFQTLKEDLTWKTTAQKHAFWWSPSAVLWVFFHAKKTPFGI